MNPNLITPEIDWQPILSRLVRRGNLPSYPGDLKADLLRHAGLSDRSEGERIYQLAVEISRLTTCCDPEVIYWFSRLVSVVGDHPAMETPRSMKRNAS